jgi:hypothetical protein
MSRGILERIVLGSVCSAAVLAILVGQTMAATKKEKEPAPAVAAAKPTKQSSEQGKSPPIQRAKKSPIVAPQERQQEAVQKQLKPASTGPKPATSKGLMPIAVERQPEAIQKQAKPEQANLKLTRLKNHRQVKVHQSEPPKVVVEPSADLMYHGRLESPQRYDPRRNHRVGAGVPDPHNPALTHDHFQELDRNQDGSIDPVERVFGRLDMDRDLYDRRPR